MINISSNFSLAFKIDCFDLEEFLSSSFASMNSLVAIYNPYSGFKLCRLRSGKIKTVSVFPFNEMKLLPRNGFFREIMLFPIVLFYSIFVTAAVLRRYELRSVLVDNTYIAGLVFPLCKIFASCSAIYCAHDWFVVDSSAVISNSSRARKLIGFFIFRFFDLIATKLSDCHYEYSSLVIRLRSKSRFCNHLIKKKELSFMGYRPFNGVDQPSGSRGRNILYFGSVPDVDALREFVRKIHGTDFKVHYAGSSSVRHLGDFSPNFVFHGFLGDIEVNELMAKCNFGLCVGRIGSHSEKVISSKFVDYLKNGIIPIVPASMAEMFSIVNDFSVGLSETEFFENVNSGWQGMEARCTRLRESMVVYNSQRLLNQFDRLLGTH